MAKKKKTKHTFARHRNAGPPRASRATKDDPETPMHRLGYTAAGAGATALVGTFLAKQGWAPKTVAGALAVLGGGLAWKGDSATIKSVGAGTMSSAGGQLALMMLDEYGKPTPAPVTAGKRLANTDELPPGSLESAFERARQQFALVGGQYTE